MKDVLNCTPALD